MTKLTLDSILISWRGGGFNDYRAGVYHEGDLTLSDIERLLITSGCPSDWAPSVPSDVKQAGDVMTSFGRSRGYTPKRAAGSTWLRTPVCPECSGMLEHGHREVTPLSDGDKTMFICATVSGGCGGMWDKVSQLRSRSYRARWTFAVSTSATAKVGQSAGTVALTAELHDETGSLLHLSGDPELIAEVRSLYRSALESSLFHAGDVSNWLKSLIRSIRIGGAATGNLLYVPARWSAQVGRLVTELAKEWGRQWTPSRERPYMLANPNDAGIAMGLAEGFDANVNELVRELASYVETEISPRRALGILSRADALGVAIDSYRLVCGSMLDRSVATLNELRARLDTMADDSAIRFSGLELDVDPDAPTTDAPTRKGPLASRVSSESKFGALEMN